MCGPLFVRSLVGLITGRHSSAWVGELIQLRTCMSM